MDTDNAPPMTPDSAITLTPLASQQREGDRFIQLAIEKDFDVDKLERLIAMRDRDRAYQAEQDYTDAMNRCQRRMPTVLTDATNTHTQKRYARLESVNRLIKPIYAEEGFTLSATEEDSPLPGHIRIVITCAHVGGHKTTHRGDFPIDGTGAAGGKSSMNGIQGIGSSISYARRYLTLMIFNVTVSDEDKDGQRIANLSEDHQAALQSLYNIGYGDAPASFQAKFWTWIKDIIGFEAKTFAEIPDKHFDELRLEMDRVAAAKQRKAGGR